MSSVLVTTNDTGSAPKRAKPAVVLAGPHAAGALQRAFRLYVKNLARLSHRKTEGPLHQQRDRHAPMAMAHSFFLILFVLHDYPRRLRRIRCARALSLGVCFVRHDTVRRLRLGDLWCSLSPTIRCW